MALRCDLCFAAPAAVAKQWVSLLVNIADCSTISADLRPDLAVPARSIALPYAWWW